MTDYHDVLADFDRYMANGSGPLVPAPVRASSCHGPIAYFCAEYGLHESLGIYSGGLGVLAGDHMKTGSATWPSRSSASGCSTGTGYFRQTIDADGHQEHAYPDYDLTRLPILPASRTRNGRPLTVSVELPGRDLSRRGLAASRSVACRSCCWTRTSPRTTTRTARSPTSCTSAAGRCASTRSWCWASAASGRIRALGIAPAVWHLNEGHSAFLLAERARELRRGRRRRSTTRCAEGPARQRLHHPHAGLGRQRALRRRPRPARRRAALDGDGGRAPAACRWSGSSSSASAWTATRAQFDMTAFSLRLTNGANAVSQLHARDRATPPGTASPTTTILGITNGVHAPTWVGEPMRELFERHLDADLDDLDDEHASRRRFWERLERIPADELWEAHLRQKRELPIFARGRLRNQLARHGEAPACSPSSTRSSIRTS